jgi:hypothetical protein
MIRDSILCCRWAVRRDSTSILAMYSTGASRASLAHAPSSLLFQRTVLAAEQPPSTALDRGEITNLVAPFRHVFGTDGRTDASIGRTRPDTQTRPLAGLSLVRGLVSQVKR